MREDIKNLIESRPIWQELNPKDPVEIAEVLRVEESVAQMRANDLVLTDLFSAYIIARRENDLPTARTVLELIEQHKKEKNHD